MQSKTLMLLNHFRDRVCSIFTHAIPREFDEARSREHFVVRVLEITPDGILGEHPYNSTKSFFFVNHIQFIQEEIELDPTNPNHAEMIKEYEKKTGHKVESDLKPPAPVAKPKTKELPVIDIQEALRDESTGGDSVFIEIASIEKLADEAKKRWDRYDQFSKS